MAMQWSSQQEEGLRKGRAWVRDVLSGRTQQRVWKLFGYAGTGKSTLTQELVGDIDGVLYCAPTGKAAKVMRSKGCEDAMTIHKAMYKVSQKGTSTLEALLLRRRQIQAGEIQAGMEELADLEQEIQNEEIRLRGLTFRMNEGAPIFEARLIVIDEASMVGSKLGADLISIGKPMLVMGDPGQLPPVKDTSFFMEDEPDVLLTQIHRQAAGSGILQLATDIREGRGYRLGKYGEDCEVVRQGDPNNRERVLAADQMIVGRNASRRQANYTLRKLKGRITAEDPHPYPVKGDKLVCVQNFRQSEFVNGSQWVCERPGVDDTKGALLNAKVRNLDDGSPAYADMHAAIFNGDEVSRAEWQLRPHFDHGEAITCHKAQGSQWDSVYVLDEAESTSRGADAKKWLYTAVTRAAKRLTLVKT